jgi:hypothetical protein
MSSANSIHSDEFGIANSTINSPEQLRIDEIIEFSSDELGKPSVCSLTSFEYLGIRLRIIIQLQWTDNVMI